MINNKSAHHLVGNAKFMTIDKPISAFKKQQFNRTDANSQVTLTIPTIDSRPTTQNKQFCGGKNFSRDLFERDPHRRNCSTCMNWFTDQGVSRPTGKDTQVSNKTQSSQPQLSRPQTKQLLHASCYRRQRPEKPKQMDLKPFLQFNLFTGSDHDFISMNSTNY